MGSGLRIFDMSPYGLDKMPSTQEMKEVGGISRELGEGKPHSYLFGSGIIRLEEAKLPVIMATAPIKDNS